MLSQMLFISAVMLLAFFFVVVFVAADAVLLGQWSNVCSFLCHRFLFTLFILHRVRFLRISRKFIHTEPLVESNCEPFCVRMSRFVWIVIVVAVVSMVNNFRRFNGLNGSHTPSHRQL